MNFVEDVLERFPASRPALVAISDGGERRLWHFGELSARAAGLSGAFAARGVGRGDIVMTLVGNRVEWVLAMLACWRMGAVAMPCSTQLRRGDLEHRVEAADPALCVGEESLLDALPAGVAAMSLADVGAALDEDRPQQTPAGVADLAAGDPALVVFTSGTTGEPRGAVHTAAYLAAQRTQATHWLGAHEGELCWVTTAPGWSKSARNVFVAPWLCGAAALIDPARFDPARRLETCEREGVNVLCQAPTEYRLLARAGRLDELRGVRRMVAAGEVLGADVVETYRDALGLDVCDGYGQTETGHVAGTHVDVEARPGSIGVPLPDLDVRAEAPEGEPGELQVRAASCPTFFSHYLDESPDQTANRLIDGEWWPTGDVVRRDPDGYLWYEARSDDLIVSSGYRIGPGEVESALLSHPAVAEVAAVPAPDAERGSVVRAVVVVSEGHDPGDHLARELQEHVKATTAPYKFPRQVEFVDELPKTPSGKVRRAALR